MRCSSKRTHKLEFRWKGPRRVTRAVSEWVFQVEKLTDGSKETVHSRRMMLYRADMDGQEVEEKLLSHASHSESFYQEIASLTVTREGEEGI